MIIVQVTESMFKESFAKMGRGEQFTEQALEALFEYELERSNDIGEPTILDPVGICSEWNEYASIQEAFEQYFDLDDIFDEDEQEELKQEYNGVFQEEHNEAATKKINFDHSLIILDGGGCLVTNG